MWYNATQELSSINDYGTSGEVADLGIAEKVSVGPVWFEGFNNFPGTRWVYQVNMGTSYNTTNGLENALEVARNVMDVVQDKLDAFELGNEPDLMVRLGVRDANFTVSEYVLQWNLYADAVSAFVLKNNSYGLEDTRLFQAFTIASSGSGEQWTG